MRPDDERDESEQFIELYETGNVFEQVAQTIVAQVRAMIQHRARYEPVDASDFPDRDTGYYDRIESELSALGFETLGDFEDAGAAPELRGQSFVRFALGAHGAIAASWFELPKPDGEPERCLALHTLARRRSHAHHRPSDAPIRDCPFLRMSSSSVSIRRGHDLDRASTW